MGMEAADPMRTPRAGNASFVQARRYAVIAGQLFRGLVGQGAWPESLLTNRPQTSKDRVVSWMRWQVLAVWISRIRRALPLAPAADPLEVKWAQARPGGGHPGNRVHGFSRSPTGVFGCFSAGYCRQLPISR